MVKNILQVPPSFLRYAQKTIKSGDDYAKLMFDTLIDQYGADPKNIDRETLAEQGTGQIIRAIIQGREPTPPQDLLADRLPNYSDRGLAKHGLTRAQYNKSIQ